MRIVDTHVHVGRHWYEPVEVLLFQMKRNGVEKAVLIQYGGSYDNSYELECARNHPGRFAPVVLVDSERGDAADTLAMWAGRGAVGIRLHPETRSPGEDPLSIWKKADELGLVVSCQGSVDGFASASFRQLVEALPNLKIVIEHLAGLQTAPGADYAAFAKAMDLARYSNTYIKLPGLGELLPRPSPFRAPPFDGPPKAMRMAYEAFGAQRVMWGSDYPPVSSREGYANALALPMEWLDFVSDDEREWIFGKTALSVWRFV